jgi:hypothetical protein
VRIELGRSPVARSAARREVRDLPADTPVVLFAAAPAAASRCRRFASRTGVQLEREYLAFPSAAAPGCLVEDAPGTIRVFIRTVLIAPPRTALAPIIDLAFRLIRGLGSWRLIRTLAPGRVVVGRRA